MVSLGSETHHDNVVVGFQGRVGDVQGLGSPEDFHIPVTMLYGLGIHAVPSIAALNSHG